VALARLDQDVAAMVPGDLPGEGEAEARPVDVRVVRRHDPAEPGEEPADG